MAHFATPGSWLFRREIHSWLQQVSLSCQLPNPYRKFAAYCGSVFFQEQIAEVLLRSLIAVDRARGHKGIVALTLPAPTMPPSTMLAPTMPAPTIFLDLHDPRFLRVPTEVKEAEAQLAPLLHEGDTFVDVGANHGSFSLAAAGLIGPRGLIIAVEPQLRLACAVERTLRETGVPFQVHPVALSSHVGSATFFRPLATSGSGGLIPAFSAVSQFEKSTVPLAKLDDLVRGRTFPGRVLVKLDIEGSEFRFLQGAVEFLANRRPRVLMEINPRAMLNAGIVLESLIAILEQAHYKFAETHAPDDARNIRELRLTTEGDHREIVLMPEEW